MPSQAVPVRVAKLAVQVRKAIQTEEARGICCPRCGGSGYLEREDWVVTDPDGRRACFRCQGEGTITRKYADPLKVRYAVAFRLLPDVRAGNLSRVIEEEEKARGGVYWPILRDVFLRARRAIGGTWTKPGKRAREAIAMEDTRHLEEHEFVEGEDGCALCGEGVYYYLHLPHEDDDGPEV